MRTGAIVMDNVIGAESCEVSSRAWLDAAVDSEPEEETQPAVLVSVVSF